ncbi:MAG: homoserine O-acetyltransferase [Bacteroidales bacterium]
MKKLTISESLTLECGNILPGYEIAYQTWGQLNERGDNVIWVAHALTANADVADWWPGMVGEGKLMDPSQYFIVCANILGSCYGSTGPLSKNPQNGNAWFRTFPLITPRDMVQAHQDLCDYLGIHTIELLIGGSIGGFQALEWAIQEPARIRHLVVLAASAYTSSWVIAFNEAQRMAIEADASFFQDIPRGGLSGMEAARAVALLSYRNGPTYNHSQPLMEEQLEKQPACSYQRYQGAKLAKRFNAYSYHLLTRAMDSHHVGRGRGGVEKALEKIKAKTLVMGMDTDWIFPTEEQKFLATYIPEAIYAEIHSAYGHDGFLIEVPEISQQIKKFINNGKTN